MQHRALENHPWFPYIAWAVVISFCLFIISLAVELNQNLDYLGETTAPTNQALENW